jgi:hypothetical protein
VILLSGAAAEPSAPTILSISLQRHPASEDHDAAVIAVMKGVRLLDGIRRQYSYSVDTAIFELFVGFHCDHRMDGRRPRRRLLCYCICSGECQEREYRQNKEDDSSS